MYGLTCKHARKHGAQNGRHGPGMDGREELEDDTVAGHGVEDSGQGKHGTKQAGAERKYRAHVYHPLNGGPTDLVVHVRERGLWVLFEHYKGFVEITFSEFDVFYDGESILSLSYKVQCVPCSKEVYLGQTSAKFYFTPWAQSSGKGKND